MEHLDTMAERLQFVLVSVVLTGMKVVFLSERI